jgi:HEPN domain-containing protein
MGESSRSPEQREYAAVLLHRAESDLRACRKLAEDEAMDDDVVRFHAQQAVEKSLKVALVLS